MKQLPSDHEDRECPEEDPSDEVSSSEDLSDAIQQQQQLQGVPKNPPKSQAEAMPATPRKEEVKQEIEEESLSSGKGVRNVLYSF